MVTQLTMAEKIKDLRIEKNLTQQELSDKIKKKTDIYISTSTLCSLENGDGKGINPTADKLKAISKYFDVSVGWLLGLEENRTTNLELRRICEYTGLSETAVNKLSDMPDLDVSMKVGSEEIRSRRANAMTYRTILNLLLSEPLGNEVLKNLIIYFCAGFVIPENEGRPLYALPWEIDNGIVNVMLSDLTDKFLREDMLRVATDKFKELRKAYFDTDSDSLRLDDYKNMSNEESKEKIVKIINHTLSETED